MIEDTNWRSRQALTLWGVYITLNILLNGTIPFMLGRDLHAWTASPIKDVLANLIVYGLIFLVVPLILTKGWDTVRQPGFLLPLTLAILAMTLRTYIRPVAAIAVLILAWLHFRYDLADFSAATPLLSIPSAPRWQGLTACSSTPPPPPRTCFISVFWRNDSRVNLERGGRLWLSA
jgi:hypothetical protein